LSTEILICVLCRPAGASRDEPRAGKALFDAVQEAAFDDASLTVRPIECLNACSRSCSVVLQAAGKTTYLFGGLVAEEACAQDVLGCARLHEASPDGMVARDTRPGLLREGVLARIPPPQD
jgi:predicted metal-binding protein